MDAATIGNRLREIRKKKNMTRVMLSELSEVSYITISQYENGRRFPQIDLLQKIAQALEVDINVLINVNIDIDTAVTLYDWVDDHRYESLNTKKITPLLNSMDGILHYLGYEVLYPITMDSAPHIKKVFNVKTGKVFDVPENELTSMIDSIVAFGKFQLSNHLPNWSETPSNELASYNFVQTQKTIKPGYLLLKKSN